MVADGMHKERRFILVRATQKHNTLRSVHRSLCIMHQFVVAAYKRAREGSATQVFGVIMNNVGYLVSGRDSTGALIGQRPMESRPEEPIFVCVRVCGEI